MRISLYDLGLGNVVLFLSVCFCLFVLDITKKGQGAKNQNKNFIISKVKPLCTVNNNIMGQMKRQLTKWGEKLQSMYLIADVLVC